MGYFLRVVFILYLTQYSADIYSQTDSIRFKMVRELTHQIKKNYVSGEIAKQMCDTLHWKLMNGKYDTSLNMDEFAFEITRDLRRISSDLHISVSKPFYNWYADTYGYNSKLDHMNDKQRKRFFVKSKKRRKRVNAKLNKRVKMDMFTYGEIKILPGNIGYVEIKDFESASFHNKDNRNRIPIKKVMNFFSNVDAIIIDLRDNQGGYIRQAAKFCSFFSPTRNNYFITDEWHFRYDSSGIERELSGASKILTSDKIDHSLTKSKAIYLLTSQRTFSAAETAVYKIKQYNSSAIIIGEKTQGGGNGHAGTTKGRYFFAVIPYLKAFDEQNGNYTLEAKGITPDILTDEASAFTTAYTLAQKGSMSGKKKTKYLRRVAELNLENEEYVIKYYPEYIGNYGKVRIVREGKELYMLYDNFRKTQLVPQTRDYFTAEHIHTVSFFRDANGSVNEIKIRFQPEYFERYRLQSR